MLFEEAQEQQDSVDQMRRELAHEKLVVSYGEVEPTPVPIARKSQKKTEVIKLPKIDHIPGNAFINGFLERTLDSKSISYLRKEN